MAALMIVSPGSLSNEKPAGSTRTRVMSPRQSRGGAAVDHEHGAIDVRRLIRREPQDRVGNLLGIGDTPEARDGRGPRGRLLLRPQGAERLHAWRQHGRVD